MRRGSFQSAPPARGMQGLVLIGGALIVIGLCWWLWPEGSDGAGPATLQKEVAEPETGQRIKRPPETKPPSGTPVPTPQPSPRDELTAARKKLATLRESGTDHEVRMHLCKFVLHPKLGADERAKLLEAADALTRRLVFSATPGPGFTTAKVRPNETYWHICRRLRKEQKIHVTHGLLAAINHVPPHRLRANTTLKVPTGRISLLVDKSDFTLYVLLDDVYVKRYPIGIGREDLTPEGSWTIGGKTAKPTWRDPKTGKMYRYGEKGHLIGSRWLGLHTGDQSSGYGIHGTIDPQTIGKAASDGCVRMVDRDVEELFDLVPGGTRVVVRR